MDSRAINSLICPHTNIDQLPIV